MTKLFIPMLGEAISRLISLKLSEEQIVIASTIGVCVSIILLLIAKLLRSRQIGDRWDDRTKYQS